MDNQVISLKNPPPWFKFQVKQPICGASTQKWPFSIISASICEIFLDLPQNCLLLNRKLPSTCAWKYVPPFQLRRATELYLDGSPSITVSALKKIIGGMRGRGGLFQKTPTQIFVARRTPLRLCSWAREQAHVPYEFTVRHKACKGF
jgi:hypothetical protein